MVAVMPPALRASMVTAPALASVPVPAPSTTALVVRSSVIVDSRAPKSTPAMPAEVSVASIDESSMAAMVVAPPAATEAPPASAARVVLVCARVKDAGNALVRTAVICTEFSALSATLAPLSTVALPLTSTVADELPV